jgi:N-acetylneuraminate lyase
MEGRVSTHPALHLHTLRTAEVTMDPIIAKFRVKGLCAAPFQPMNPGGSLNHAAIPSHAEELAQQGVNYVFVGGTTGEGLRLSVAERKAVTEAWLKSGAVQVIAHIGAEALPDAQELAAHAQASGCVAVGLQPSVFFKPDGVDGIIAYVEAIAAHCPALPVYYYHLAIMTGVHVRCDLLVARVAEVQHTTGRLANFRGIKYSDPDLHFAANAAAAVAYVDGAPVVGGFDILYGKDEQLAGALACAGLQGAVGSTYNYMGRVGNAIIAAAAANKSALVLAETRKLQLVVNLLHCSSSYGPGGCNVGKAIMSLRIAASGLAKAGKPVTGETVAGAVGEADMCGPARLPGTSVTAAGLLKLSNELAALGFYTW